MSIIEGIGRAINQAAGAIEQTAAKITGNKQVQLEEKSPAIQQDSSALSDMASQVGGAKVASLDEQPAQAAEYKYSDQGHSQDVTALASRMTESKNVKHPEKTGKTEELTVLRAGSQDDTINVSRGEAGGLKVNVNGQEFSYSASEAANLIIDAGEGNDTINADEDVRAALHITGGAGNDTIRGGQGKDFIIDNYDSNTIDGGKGNDEITANGESSKGFWSKLWGGITGAEKPSNTINGGDGDDYIEGGKGNDTISGGLGDDYIYGLDGNDTLNGEDGSDYLDGGKGNDTIAGGNGNDKLFGGVGADTIDGGADTDVLAGGRGKDTIDGGAGADNITLMDGKNNADVNAADSNDNVSSVSYRHAPLNVFVSGSDGFEARAKSDLETMASTQVGQQMFNALADEGHVVNIVDTDSGSVCEYLDTGTVKYDSDNNAKNGWGSPSTVRYNTSSHNMYNDRENWSEHAPITTLHHELTHSYNAGKGNLDGASYDDYTLEHLYNEDGSYTQDKDQGPTGAEYQAVGGLGNPSVADNPEGVNENSLRNYLGYEKREYYWPTPAQAKNAGN